MGKDKDIQSIAGKRNTEYGYQAKDINKALDEIDETEYRQTLKTILKKKERELTEDDFAKRKQKLVNFALGRGFESRLVWDVIEDMM